MNMFTPASLTKTTYLLLTRQRIITKHIYEYYHPRLSDKDHKLVIYKAKHTNEMYMNMLTPAVPRYAY